jgi:hypothetical protein
MLDGLTPAIKIEVIKHIVEKKLSKRDTKLISCTEKSE